MAPIFKLRFAQIVLALGLAFTCFFGMHAQLGAAQSFSVTHAKVSLIAEGSTFQPNHKEWIGVLFDLEKGWHIYWVNPGDSGEPPKIQWQLPSGFHAGDIRWPVPARLGTGTVIDYGYDGRVLLPVPIEVPANYSPASRATLAADVRYLICREVCIPAKAHVTLDVPAAGAAAAEASVRQEAFPWDSAYLCGATGPLYSASVTSLSQVISGIKPSTSPSTRSVRSTKPRWTSRASPSSLRSRPS